MRLVSLLLLLLSGILLPFRGRATAETIQFIISFDENCNTQIIFGEKDSTPFKCSGNQGITYTYGKQFSQFIQPGFVQINDKGAFPGQVTPSDLIDFPDAGLDAKGK